MAGFLRSYGWLLLVTAMLTVFGSVYVVAGIAPSSLARLIGYYTMPICFSTWVQADARSRRCTPCFDFGTFVLLIWLLSVPWYLIWTRRWRGVLVSVMFFGLLIFPAVVADFVSIALGMLAA